MENLSWIAADGMVGLAPDAEPSQSYPAFLNELKREDVIDRSVFTLYLGKKGVQSKVWFGGYDLEYIRLGL
jgi:hypothetical protein